MKRRRSVMTEQKRQAVCVDGERLQREVAYWLSDIVATLQGPENGVESDMTFGLEELRLKLYKAVEQAKGQGREKVLDLLVYDWLPVPLQEACADEPGWYLTLSLSA